MTADDYMNQQTAARTQDWGWLTGNTLSEATTAKTLSVSGGSVITVSGDSHYTYGKIQDLRVDDLIKRIEMLERILLFTPRSICNDLKDRVLKFNLE